MRVRFLLICEDSSDAALVSHIHALLIECGASEADGAASFRGRLVRDKVPLGYSIMAAGTYYLFTAMPIDKTLIRDTARSDRAYRLPGTRSNGSA